jgi:hypothetical protein
VTCTEKERQHPLDYFAFDEGGKVWWFDFDSLWQWSVQSPVNPYTRTPLTQDTRMRLWAVWAYRSRALVEPPPEPKTLDARLASRWTVICRVFADNGFVDVHPGQFQGFTKADFLSMFILLKRDLDSVLPSWDPVKARALRFCDRGIRTANRLSPLYRLQSTYTLLLLLTLHKNPYTMVFSILSALYRC